MDMVSYNNSYITHDVLHFFQLKVFRQRAWGFFNNDRLYRIMFPLFPTLGDPSDKTVNFSGGSSGCLYDQSMLQDWVDYWRGLDMHHPQPREVGDGDEKLQDK